MTDTDFRELNNKLESVVAVIGSFKAIPLDEEVYWKSVNTILKRWTSQVRQCEMRRLEHTMSILDVIGENVTNQARHEIFEKEKKIVEKAFEKSHSKTPFLILLARLKEAHKVLLKDLLYTYREHLVWDFRNSLERIRAIENRDERQTEITKRLARLDEEIRSGYCEKADEHVKSHLLNPDVNSDCEIERSILHCKSVEEYCFNDDTE